MLWTSMGTLALAQLLGGVAAPGGPAIESSVVVTIPPGAVTLTTPYTPSHPLELGDAHVDPATSTYAASVPVEDIVVTDTRAGETGFAVTVTAAPFVRGSGGSFAASYAGLVGLTAEQVPGNALQAADVRLTDVRPGTPGLAVPSVFARYPAGAPGGTVHLGGDLIVTGLPTSVAPGRYTTTLTLTVL